MFISLLFISVGSRPSNMLVYLRDVPANMLVYLRDVPATC